MFVSSELTNRAEEISKRFGYSDDLIIKSFELRGHHQSKLLLIYISTLTDMDRIERMMEGITKLTAMTVGDQIEQTEESVLSYLSSYLLPQGESNLLEDWSDVEQALLSGRTLFVTSKVPHVLAAVQSRSEAERSVEEPSTQTVIRGPRDGFTETLTTNLNLLRKRIKDANLWVEIRQVGRKTRTDVALVYMNGSVNKEVLKRLRKRLDKIELDSVLESSYIEEWISEPLKSPFPTVFNTERPDATAAGILEGRVAIFVNGTPFVLMVPALFVQFFQASEDYYHPALFSSLRTLRFVASFGALLLPALYIAITTYHQEIIPTSLLISVMAQREGVPFPTFIEALIMELTFEILREAGIRMPKMIGQAISIVGALVLGEAAVQAGLISAAMVIVVAFTAITNLMIPAISMGNSVRFLRFIFMVLAAVFGLYGIFIGVCMLHIHLCHMRSFGVPYMYPISPFDAQAMRDTFFRTKRSKRRHPESLFHHLKLDEEETSEA